jgi:hypothetical protein
MAGRGRLLAEISWLNLCLLASQVEPGFPEVDRVGDLAQRLVAGVQMAG